MMILTKQQTTALQDTANALSVPVEWLYRLIKFESGFNPRVKNPYSSARGLIQFTDGTARALGYKDSSDLVDKNRTIERQLRSPVLKYLSQYAPYPTAQSLYMAVFYPSFRYVSPDTLFTDTVRSVNPGIARVSDYVNKVEGVKISPASSAFFAMLAAAGLFFF